MKTIYKVFLVFWAVASCQGPEKSTETDIPEQPHTILPYFTYHANNLFPGDGSLLRAEDGLALPDGRIIVVDQATGLRLIEKNGSSRPFGNFADVGFKHSPPESISGPNGVILEHDGKHVIMSDVGDGKIYRTSIASEEVEMIYDHPFGVNTIYRDHTGALWFTQSTQNSSMKDLLKDVDQASPEGAVFRMADFNSEPVKIADSLYFANGITMDKEENKLYVAETLMDRVHVFDVDTDSGSVNYAGVAARIGTPDNILIDQAGRLIVASPLFNQIIAVDFKNHSQHTLFDGSNARNKKLSDEWDRRSHLGLKRSDVFSPEIYHPLPGLLTGMFYSHDHKTLYVSNLGNDLLKYEFE